MAYTKLFASIVTSTIWGEDNETRIIWITMMALSDKNGEVQASVPGLARVAGVSVEACESAIQKFLSPDRYSRTPDDEGRRIEPIDGGWRLINHAKYRDKASREESKSANAERQAAFRERKKRNATVTPSNNQSRSVTVPLHIADADADTKADADGEQRASEKAPKKPRRKPSVPIPTSWVPLARHASRASERGVDCSLAAEKFRAHAESQDRRCADWDRAFDNWLLNERGFSGGARRTGNENAVGFDAFERVRMLREQEERQNGTQ